jgi:hypothetical protein
MSQISFEDLLFEDTIKDQPEPTLSSPLEKSILALISDGAISARDICERLIEQNNISAERYSSAKPKDYHKVCVVLDNLVMKEKLLLVEAREKNDRIYQLK